MTFCLCPKRLLHKLTKWLGYFIALFIVLAATLVSVGRLLTPYFNDHLPDFEVWASELLETPVKIGKVYISWNIYVPQLTFDNVVVVNKESHKNTFEINQIKINLKLLDSLLQRKPLPSYLKISGVDVTIRAEKSGKVNIAGLGNFAVTDNLTGASEEGNTVAQWIFSQPALILDNINIKFIPEKGGAKLISLYKLSLHNTKSRHVLRGRATLNQEISTHVLFNLDWRGDMSDPSKISANFYAYLEAVSLPQWLKNQAWKNLQIEEGLGSAKIWMEWDKGQFQKIQTQFQIYELRMHSLISDKTQTITRLNGNLGWKREGNNQIFAGNDILIDLPEHLWPVTSFYITLPVAEAPTKEVTPLAPSLPAANTSEVTQFIEKNKEKLNGLSIHINYMDFADSYEFITSSGMLPEKLQAILLTLKPKGELRAFDFKLNDVDHLEKSVLSAAFNGLSFNAWQKYPGVKNLNGTIDWAKKNGHLEMSAEHGALMPNALFAHPIAFDQFTGQVKFQKNSQGIWFLNAKNITIENDDLNIQADSKLTIVPNESPNIDFAASLSMKNANQIANYLPTKVMDPELSRWLKQAFHQGQLDSGKVIIQGKLSDFPFANNNGKFIFSVEGKDLDFSFASDWPRIKHLNGSILFAGHKMTVNLQNGQLQSIPISNVLAEIPYIGPKQPQILDVKGVIHGDFAQGLQFIHESPLQKTIGKELNALNLSGPMQLDLHLSVPVKRPEHTVVKGDVTFPNVNLSMPGWELTLDQLSGILHFTEKDIQATNVHGQLFNEPIVLNINTEHPAKAPSYINITLQSKISEALLHSWLNDVNITEYVKGSTDYTAEIHLVSSEQAEPIQMTIRSDLKGVALNLPEGFGKTADQTMNTTFLANIKENQPLQVKLNLGTKLSAAVTIKNRQFYNGELRLNGKGEANWQTQPGLLISGQFDQLDWNELKKSFSEINKEPPPNETKPEAKSSMIDMVRAIDIRANKITGLAQNLSRAHVQISRAKTNWNINLTAAEMAGQITLPIKMSSKQTIKANFQYLYLSPVESKTEPLNPKDLPGISFASNEVRFDGKSLGRVTFDLQPSSTGLTINSLRADSSLYNLKASGDWSSTNNKSQTRLRGTLSTNNVANFLNHWGSSSPNPVGSKGSMSFDLSWADAPYNPVLSGMSGDAYLDISSGSIINLGTSTNAKMGFGRMLNILSVQSLSKVLTLNFSDLTTQGYTFDYVKGNFNLDKGNIYTEDTGMDGSLAQIEISGRIGLTAKDYNLNLDITPKMMGSIPVVAAIAVNPLIGVAAWAVEKVASSAVSGATTRHYIVTGSWDKPEWREK